MRDAILRKFVKEVACEERRGVSGRVVGFFNLDVTKVSELGISVKRGCLARSQDLRRAAMEIG